METSLKAPLQRIVFHLNLLNSVLAKLYREFEFYSFRHVLDSDCKTNNIKNMSLPSASRPMSTKSDLEARAPLSLRPLRSFHPCRVDCRREAGWNFARKYKPDYPFPISSQWVTWLSLTNCRRLTNGQADRQLPWLSGKIRVISLASTGIGDHYSTRTLCTGSGLLNNMASELRFDW